ncbi:MAG TPA: MgtC/SapB family protein [Candidatus Saccharimonadales bacterium]|nr:MgtC/SapB family protein [Candidatus Saccharimonadales bacterium]
MSTTIGWSDVALRLALSVVAGALIGFNRTERGRPAGLRTTLLVCLAASIAMIQMNLLLGVGGKRADSFGVMDVMRLPLGILSGIGFIGAGAILRRGDRVTGVTTAATLWFVTVMGLCFGGGQIGLGLTALALGMATLWLLKWVEHNCAHQRSATLVITAGAESPTEDELEATVKAAGFHIDYWAVAYLEHAQQRTFRCEVKWRGRHSDARPPAFVKELAQHPRVMDLHWKPLGTQG